MKKIISCLLALTLSAWQAVPAWACTGIAFATKDGAHLQARTIEWGGFSLDSKLVIMPRGQQNTSFTPQGQNGLSWKNKYGAVGISTVKDAFIGEGVNEKGLGAGIFYFSGYGSLAPFNAKKAKKSVADVELVRWMLTNFATVEEVITALKKIEIISIYPPQPGQKAASTGHWRISDATGRSIVLEIENNGQRHIYENTVGVFTNSPSFPWQVTHLNNYVNLHPGAITPNKLGKTELTAFGAGAGMWGLPGDITPPSRFVRAFFYLHTAPVPATAQEGVLQAFHILNNFDIPIGVEFASGEEVPNLPSATQWTSVTNLTQPAFYYRTMNNSQIRLVDLSKINFAGVKAQVLPLDKEPEQIHLVELE